ncbi:hypothetical protein Bca52824_017452 [Brassica carinata]|uniref:Uncharacterized protein n=1 Tax=Brassica carinata TaxID=52824 RepID=A0A8X7VN48_BRACI|nr:hypothetical protein Bca52824_017452 [Brassica carinata]
MQSRIFHRGETDCRWNCHHGFKHQAISMLPDDIELSPMPDYHHTRGPHRDCADQAATFLIREIIMKALADRANILVISGNYHVMGAVNQWSRDVFMMLALPESSSSPDCYHIANVTWLWASEDFERAAATMVNGGGPIPPVPRVRG